MLAALDIDLCLLRIAIQCNACKDILLAKGVLVVEIAGLEDHDNQSPDFLSRHRGGVMGVEGRERRLLSACGVAMKKGAR